jgi:membrane protein DedA with SNARE-associated domain
MSAQDFEVLLRYGYLGILLALYIEHVMPPLPSNVVLPIAGYMIGQGEMNYWVVLLAASAGGMLGSLTLYALGYKMGEKPIRRYAGWFKLPEERIERAFAFSRRHGNNSVFALHAVPISPIRVIVSIMAGVNKLSMLRFVAASWIGTVIWISLTLYVTAFASERWGYLIEDALEQQEWLIWGSLIAGVIFSLLAIYRLKGTPSES